MFNSRPQSQAIFCQQLIPRALDVDVLSVLNVLRATSLLCLGRGFGRWRGVVGSLGWGQPDPTDPDCLDFRWSISSRIWNLPKKPIAHASCQLVPSLLLAWSGDLQSNRFDFPETDPKQIPGFIFWGGSICVFYAYVSFFVCVCGCASVRACVCAGRQVHEWVLGI